MTISFNYQIKSYLKIINMLFIIIFVHSIKIMFIIIFGISFNNGDVKLFDILLCQSLSQFSYIPFHYLKIVYYHISDEVQ
jgi:hypothetical protein